MWNLPKQLNNNIEDEWCGSSLENFILGVIEFWAFV